MSEAIKQAGDALTAVSAYPEIRQYIGTVLHDQIREALAALSAEQPKPVAEMVYFKRVGSDTVDRLPVAVGTAAQHVNSSLVTQIVPLYDSPIAAPASQPTNTVRYCFECGSIGEIDKRFLGCCPDNRNDYVRKEIAEQARSGFHAQLKEFENVVGQPKCEKCGGSVCNIHGIEGAVMCNTCDHMQDSVTASQPDAAAIRNKAMMDAIDAVEGVNSQCDAQDSALLAAANAIRALATQSEPAQQEPIGYISADTLKKLQDPEWQKLRGEGLTLWTVNNPPSRARIPVFAAPAEQQAGQSAPAVPDNCVIVPKEPTPEMCFAARRVVAEYPIKDDANSPVVIYRAMINAAPAQEGTTK